MALHSHFNEASNDIIDISFRWKKLILYWYMKVILQKRKVTLLIYIPESNGVYLISTFIFKQNLNILTVLSNVLSRNLTEGKYFLFPMEIVNMLTFYNYRNSKHRERHAKTLEIAQEEVLTCIGMCLYERLRRISVCLREEENACQVLAAVAVHALSRSFDMAVERKQGISNLELLYEEISREERSKEHKKEQKKLKKRRKRNEKKLIDNTSDKAVECSDETDSKLCSCSPDDNEEDDEEADDRVMLCDGTIIDAGPKSTITINRNEADTSKMQIISCSSCEMSNIDKFSNTNICTRSSFDGGYASEPLQSESLHTSSHMDSTTSSLVSTPEGSEIACSDGLCNHGGSIHSKNRYAPFSNTSFFGTMRSPNMLLNSMSGLPMTLQEMLVSIFRYYSIL